MFPLIAPFVALGATIIESVGSAAAIVAAYIIAKLTAKGFILASQITVSIFLIASHVILLGFFIYAIPFFYNRYNELLEIVSIASQQSEVLDIVVKVLQTIGLFDAFNFVFDLFTPFILTYLGYRLTLIVYWSFKATSDELFKIGVLTQQ